MKLNLLKASLMPGTQLADVDCPYSNGSGEEWHITGCLSDSKSPILSISSEIALNSTVRIQRSAMMRIGGCEKSGAGALLTAMCPHHMPRPVVPASLNTVGYSTLPLATFNQLLRRKIQEWGCKTPVQSIQSDTEGNKIWKRCQRCRLLSGVADIISQIKRKTQCTNITTTRGVAGLRDYRASSLVYQLAATTECALLR